MSKTVLISGAGGFLGKELLRQLLMHTNFFVIALSSQKDLIKNEYVDTERLHCFDFIDLERGLIPFAKINYVINCAFSRSNNSESLTNSLDFTKNFLLMSTSAGIDGFINISSQSVYGSPYNPLWTETTPPTNSSLYAMAKYTTELLTESICSTSAHSSFTNIRLSSLIGVGFEQRIVNKFVKSVLVKEPIVLSNAEQVVSYLDVRDAAAGIIEMIKTKHGTWEAIYNLGHFQRYSFLEIVNTIKSVAIDFGINNVKVNADNDGTPFDTGMNSSKFYQQTGWRPQLQLEDTIRSLFEYYNNVSY